MSERFDDLTRAMAAHRSRRSVLKLFGAAAASAVGAAVLGPFRADAVTTTCAGPTTVPCRAGTTPCGPCCCKGGVACLNRRTGACGCPAGTTPCGEACCTSGVACSNSATSTCAGSTAACLDPTTAPCASGCCTCLPSGSGCEAGGAPCCGGTACINNICQSKTCVTTGQSCTVIAESECCSQFCITAAGRHCAGVALGKTCTSATQCTTGAECRKGVCCNPSGQFCNADNDCCSGTCGGGNTCQ